MKPTPEQRENLKKLAYHLLGPLKRKFDMSRVTQCAIGHTPDAGLGHYLSALYPNTCEVNNYIFSYSWWEFDNTARGCARRIIRYLSHDCEIPKGFVRPCKEFVI